jgi:nickel-dependent lactate racemase
VTDDQILDALASGLETTVAGEDVLVLVPDHTRRIPLDRILPALSQVLHRAKGVRVMVALGTHPPLPAEDLAALAVLIPAPVLNHAWQDDRELVSVGAISADQIRQTAGVIWHPSLGGPLDVRINRAAVEADRVVIVGPTLPHEVAGYSGGAKYLFPGISGPEMIDTMHWLGALTGVMGTIGRADTPVRALIDQAAALLPTPVSLVAAVTHDADLAGLFVGGIETAWASSVELAEGLHTVWLDRPFERVVSRPLPIYGELWTAAKAVYKLESAVADGGELIVHALALDTVSRTHGAGIFEVGYHVMPYFLEQWDRFGKVPLAVLAHSTHVKGAGSYVDGREQARIDVRLATGISPDDCRRLNLGYTDPDDPTLTADSRTLVVPDSGEVLYRVR